MRNLTLAQVCYIKETWILVMALALLLSSFEKLLATDEGSNCLVPKPVLHLKLDKQFFLELCHGAGNEKFHMKHRHACMSFNSNLNLHISLTSHRLYVYRKEKSLKDF